MTRSRRRVATGTRIQAPLREEDAVAEGASASDSYLPLFVYGTLREGESAAGLIEGTVVHRAAACAMGRREDVGAHYPAVTFGVADEEISGELLWLDRDQFARTIAGLDAYEGVPTLFRRVRIRVRTGDEELEAYAYEWVPRE